MQIEINRVKIAVTIPEENVDEIRNAVCEAGAGIIGEYSHCTMSTKCIGTFKPTEKARPYIGESNRLEYVKEEKLEFVCGVNMVRKVVEKLREVHPYEEPGIDIYPLIDEDCFY